MPCSIQLHETQANSTNLMTINNDMQIPVSGLQNEATIITPQFHKPTKTSTHLTKIYQTQLHTVKIWNED